MFILFAFNGMDLGKWMLGKSQRGLHTMCIDIVRHYKILKAKSMMFQRETSDSRGMLCI